MSNCILTHTLVKIEREQFYSLHQKETFVVQCGTEVVDTYSVDNLNYNITDTICGLAVFTGFTLLLLWEWKTKKKIWE